MIIPKKQILNDFLCHSTPFFIEVNNFNHKLKISHRLIV